ncbi:MAG TPA: hypothetical protein VGM34_01875, partial [Chlamydiales bacterium]
MRRILFSFGLFLCVLVASTICWRGTLRVAVKTWAYCSMGGELSYKSLERENGAFVFREMALVQDGVPWFTAEKFAIQVNLLWPFKGAVDVERPQVTLSQERAHQILSGNEKEGGFRWTLRLHDGRLRWSDGMLPDAEWSFSRKEKGHLGELFLSWGEKSIFLDFSKQGGKQRWEGAATHLPLDYLSRLMGLVELGSMSECTGELSGSFHCVWNQHKLEDVSFQAEGKALAARVGSLALGGDISANAEMSQGEINRFRLSVEKGHLAAGEATVCDLSILASFHEAGTKWECKANAFLRGATELPFEIQGREARFDWVEGTWRLGLSSGSFSKDAEWMFNWNQVSALEGALVQEFVAAIYPEVAFWKMNGGVMSGTLKGPSLKELAVTSFEGENLACDEVGSCRHLECQSGVWTVEGGSCSLLGIEKFDGQWDTAGLGIEISGQGPGPWNLTGSLEYKKGGFFAEHLKGGIDGLSFNARGFLKPASNWTFSLEVPSFSGEIPSWVKKFKLPLAQGKIHSLGSGLFLQGSFQKTPQNFARSLAFHFSDV